MKAKRPFKMPKYERYDDSNGRGSSSEWRASFRRAIGPDAPEGQLGGGGPRGVLGLSESAAWPEIRAAYRKLVMQHHPDRGGDPAAFRKIQEAYETLKENR